MYFGKKKAILKFFAGCYFSAVFWGGDLYQKCFRNWSELWEKAVFGLSFRTKTREKSPKFDKVCCGAFSRAPVHVVSQEGYLGCSACFWLFHHIFSHFFHHIKCRVFCTISNSSKWTSLALKTWNHHSCCLDLATAMAQHDVTRNLGHFWRNFHSISKLFGINMSAVPTVSAEAFHATVGCPSLFNAARPERDFLEDFGLKKNLHKKSQWVKSGLAFCFFFGGSREGVPKKWQAGVVSDFHLLGSFLAVSSTNSVG